MVDRNQMHYLSVTAIIVNAAGKYLVAKRSEREKAFPGKWTVPGGKLEVLDYALRNKDTSQHWYNVFEDVAKRECREEVGLEVRDIGYVTNMVYIRPDGIPSIIVSFYAFADSDIVRLCDALTDYKWVTLEEAREIDLIEGIYEEIELLENILHGKKKEIFLH